MRLVPSPLPSRAVRLDRPPRPVLRPLGEVLAELRAAVPAPPSSSPEASPGAPTAAEPDPERAAAAARPFAVRVLGALAEVLDGRRPLGHLAGVCPAADAARLAEHVAAGRALRVSGVRLCGVTDDAVEAAAVIHGPTRSRAVCARLARAPDARSGWRIASLVVL